MTHEPEAEIHIGTNQIGHRGGVVFKFPEGHRNVAMPFLKAPGGSMHAEIPVVLNRWLACHIAVAKASVSSCTASRDASRLLMGSSIAIGELKQHVEQS
jgi:hypothetical protein